MEAGGGEGWGPRSRALGYRSEAPAGDRVYRDRDRLKAVVKDLDRFLNVRELGIEQPMRPA